MKHKLTPEETAARDAKRARFQSLVKNLAAMPDAERAGLAVQCGAVLTVEGRGLSVTNTILCFLQRPGVSVVGGFRQWLAAGRCVRKGEHGLTIWIPLGAKANEAGETGDGKRFGTATVFDVGQTVEFVKDQAGQDETAAGEPVAVVSSFVADTFNMHGLPNVRISEEVGT